MQAPAETDLVLALADDELIIGWRDSEWTGVAPYLEEDVAFSSIAQNEIGHARALYELRLMDWEDTIARRVLYELADEVRIQALVAGDAPELAGLARKIDREEAYHRIHARMWAERLLATAEGRERLLASVRKLWPLALGALPDDQTGTFRAAAEALLGPEAAGADPGPDDGRGAHTPELAPLWEEMTMVRRSAPGARW